MTYITRFTITGLAGRAGVYEQTLDRHTNVFFGLNGCGKTSLLRILDSAMSNHAEQLASVPFASAEVFFYSDALDTEFKRTLDKKTLRQASSRGQRSGSGGLWGSQTWLTLASQVPWTTEPPTPDRTSGSFEHVFLPISRMFSPLESIASASLASHFVSQEPRSLEERLNENFGETIKQVWAAYFSGVLAAVGEAQARGLANVLKAVLTPEGRENAPGNLSPDLAFSRVASFLKRQGSHHIIPSEKLFRRRYSQDPELRSVVSDIDDVEKSVEAAMAPRMKLQELIARMFSGGKSVSFGDQKIEVQVADRTQIALGMLSSGEKQILRLFVEALRAGPNSLLIDEPELSMHVDWQRELLALIRTLNPETQIIVATHSPEIMAEIDDERILRL